MPNTFNRSQIGLIIEQIKKKCPDVERYIPQVPVPRAGRPWEIMVGRYQLALQKCLGKPCIGTGVDPYKLDIYPVIISFCSPAELAVFDKTAITNPPPIIVSSILRAKSENNKAMIYLEEVTVVKRVTMTVWIDVSETKYMPLIYLGAKDGQCKEVSINIINYLQAWNATLEWDKPSESSGGESSSSGSSSGGGEVPLPLKPIQLTTGSQPVAKENVTCQSCVVTSKSPSINSNTAIILDIDLENKKATLYDSNLNIIGDIDASQCPDLDQPVTISAMMLLQNVPDNYVMKSGIDWIAWK